MILERGYIEHVKKCHKFQVYSDKINTPPTPLFIVTSSWSFSMQEIDVIGYVNPKASNGHWFNLMAIN
jgi:hypothetical protein